MAKKKRMVQMCCARIFPVPGQNIVGDWRICEINEVGAIKKILSKAYLSRDAAYGAVEQMERGYYTVKKIYTSKGK